MNRSEFYDSLKNYNKHDLMHTGAALYGTKRENVKYYKREGEPGSYKYYYTKEEYDAAHQNGGEANTQNKAVDISSGKSSKRKAGSAIKEAASNKVGAGSTITYSTLQKTNKINRAKTSNMYDQKFVDVIKYMDGMNKDLCLSEYNKYLADPNNYPEKTIHTLLTDYSQGGNVDLNNRPEIDAKELTSKGYEAGDGYATIFSSVFSNEKGDVAYNFTPIQVDPKTGEFIRVLDPKEFDDYCNSVVNGEREDLCNLQIGGAFTGDDAIQQAVNRGKDIHGLHENLHVINEEKKSK